MNRKALYAVWERMIDRCHNAKAQKYKFYGGRGVTVCDEWSNDYGVFKRWAIENGWKEGLQLDKDTIGNGLLYSPQTCCFITKKENQRARRHLLKHDYNGKLLTLVEICESLGLNHAVVRQRMSRDKLSFEEAISRQTGNGNQHFPRKKEYCLSDASREKMRQSAIAREAKKREQKTLEIEYQ